MATLTVDVKGAADILQCSPRTVYELAENGTLPAFKVGSAWGFLVDELVNWLRAQVIEQTSKRMAKKIRGPQPPDEAKLIPDDTKRKPTLSELERFVARIAA